MLGNMVVAIRISESSTSTAMITLAIAFSQGGFDHGPEHLAVVAEQQQKHGGARQSTPGERLHRGGDQAERGARDQHDAGRERRPSAVKLA